MRKGFGNSLIEDVSHHEGIRRNIRIDIPLIFLTAFFGLKTGVAAIFDKISGDLLIYDLYIPHHTCIAVFKKILCRIREYKPIIAKRSPPLLCFCLMLYPLLCTAVSQNPFIQL